MSSVSGKSGPRNFLGERTLSSRGLQSERRSHDRRGIDTRIGYVSRVRSPLEFFERRAMVESLLDKVLRPWVIDLRRGERSFDTIA